MRARVLVDAPVAGPGAAHARAARGVTRAVVEGKVTGDEVLVSLTGPDGEGHESVVRAGRDVGAVSNTRGSAPEPLLHHLGVGGGCAAPHTLVLGTNWQFGQRPDCENHLSKKIINS